MKEGKKEGTMKERRKEGMMEGEKGWRKEEGGRKQGKERKRKEWDSLVPELPSSKGFFSAAEANIGGW